MWPRLLDAFYCQMRRISLQNGPEIPIRNGMHFSAIRSNYNGMTVYICCRYTPAAAFKVYSFQFSSAFWPRSTIVAVVAHLSSQCRLELWLTSLIIELNLESVNLPACLMPKSKEVITRFEVTVRLRTHTHMADRLLYVDHQIPLRQFTLERKAKETLASRIEIVCVSATLYTFAHIALRCLKQANQK